jgi:type I restriction enzyme S subunit
MAVKKGYKQTEVGMIPEDWEITFVEDVAEITTGGKNTQDRFDDGIYPFFVRSQTVERINSYSFDGEAVLTAGDGVGTGKVFHYINGKFDTHQRVYRMTGFGTRVNGYFFFLYFSNHFYSRIMQMTAKSSVDSVRRDMIARMKIPLPPTLTEQEAIAGALSDADAWIESLEQLIAKKRQIKQGAMQELLTGKRRLPGFSGEWEETTLGELATFLSGGTPSRNNDGFWTGDIPWISASSLRCFEIWRSDSNVTKEAVVSGSKIAPVGSSLLLVRGSALHKEILCGLVIKPVCFNQDVKALVPYSQVVPRFLTMLIRGMADAMLKLVSSAGNTAGVLDTKLLKAFAIRLPTPNEQTAIATVLSDMDTEIGSLESKLAKAREIKQGMMQELLTGKIRLV